MKNLIAIVLILSPVWVIADVTSPGHQKSIYNFPHKDSSQTKESQPPDFGDLSHGEISAISNADRTELERVLQLVEDSQLAFQSKAEILAKYPNAFVTTTEKTDIQFFIVKDQKKKEQTLVIRGSANVKNWVTNFKFWKVKDLWLSIRLHKGYYEASREIFWKSIFHIDPTYKTVVTGHSLGGACAIILAMYLDNYGHPDVSAVSFGQPRITNKKGKKKYNGFPYTRVAMKRDIVTHLLPIFIGYRHFGKKLELRGDEMVWVSSEIDDDPGNVPPQSIELWNKWTAGQDGGVFPTLEPPVLSIVWQEIRQGKPKDMQSLFNSAAWKRLTNIASQLPGGHAPPSTLGADNGADPDGEVGDWVKYHNIKRYKAQIMKLIEAFPGE
jgi:hypothetical protein